MSRIAAKVTDRKMPVDCDHETGPAEPPTELGEISQDPVKQATEEATEQDPFTVKWQGPDDPGDPLNTPTWRKWVITIVLAVCTACVTSDSSICASTYEQMGPEFGVSNLVCTLTVTLYVLGIGTGPLLFGPCSEFLGRSKVLHFASVLFFACNFGVAFAPNITVALIFRFLSGFFGSAFSSVSGGSVSDVFPNHKVGTPMMIWSAMPFFGPILGPLIGGFINQNADWRWTYYTVIIWSGIMTVLLLSFVPETYEPVLLKKRAIRIRQESGDERYQAPIELLNRSFLQALKTSLKTPFVLLTTQYMVLALDTWTAMLSGILYLFFGGVPWIFRTVHGFTLQQTGMAFLGLAIGQISAICMQPYFQRKYRRAAAAAGGIAPPEARLSMGKVSAIACPVGLILMGLTSFSNVHWIVPIIFSASFGAGVVFAYTATLTYLVDAYRPVAASALASNSFMRNMTAGGFPLFGVQLYESLGAVGGTCLLGGIMVLFVPLPFVFHRYGARIRARSNVAAS